MQSFLAAFLPILSLFGGRRDQGSVRPTPSFVSARAMNGGNVKALDDGLVAATQWRA